ncbi:MAG: hypothetical protein LBU58_05850, partial [Clostridiales bacterium]|nr:hypothetical protein [Clostridiales bacterium]
CCSTRNEEVGDCCRSAPRESGKLREIAVGGRQIKAGNFNGECPIQETGRQVTVQIVFTAHAYRFYDLRKRGLFI